MNVLLVFLGLAAIVGAEHPAGLRVKFDYGFRPEKDFFYAIPRNITQCEEQGWVETPRADGPRPTCVLYCLPDDTSCCGYYDPETGYICGMQYAFDEADLVNVILDFDVQGYHDWIVSGVKHKATDAFFVSDDRMALTVEERIASFNSSKLLQEDKLFVTGYYGEIDEISVYEADILKTDYTKQACIPWMGKHYYKNMSSTTECKSDKMYPWFIYTDLDRVIGYALVILGTINERSPKKAHNWFENPSPLAVSAIVTDGPDCLYDIVKKYGLKTCHNYIIDKPWKVGCNLFG